MFETTFFYILLTLVLIFLCNLSKRGKNDMGVFFAYLVLVFVSVIRYDVGWDYIGYSINVQNLCNTGFSDIASIIIATSGKISEPFFIGLCYIFQNMETPYLWVFGCYAFLTILFVFLAVNNHSFRNLDPERNKWALIAMILYYFLFFMWDGQRQGLAIAIVLFSYKYIQDKSIIKFLLTITFACLIHLSAFLAIPIYWLSLMRFKKGISLVVIMICLFLYVIGAFKSLVSLADMIPYYSRYAENSEYMDGFYGFSVLMLLKYLMWIMTICLIPSNQKLVGNSFTIGVLIYIVASGAQIFERVGDYYYFSIIVLLPDIATYMKRNRGLLYVMIALVSFVCFYDMAITQKRGVMPYKTIMSNDYQKGHFKDREVDFN